MTIMNNYKITLLAVLALMAMNANGFATAPAFTLRATAAISSSMRAAAAADEKSDIDVEVDVGTVSMEEKVAPDTEAEASKPAVAVEAAAPKKKPVKKAAGHGKDGVFSPVVKTAKSVLGDAELNKLRGKVIGMHSEVIGNFVETSDTVFGQTILKKMFAIVDVDKNGTVEIDELERGLKKLGFDFLNEKQLQGIFQRADADSDGHIDEEEWRKNAPKTLRTNLIKLAKKNGADLGFLS